MIIAVRHHAVRIDGILADHAACFRIAQVAGIQVAKADAIEAIRIFQQRGDAASVDAPDPALSAGCGERQRSR